MLGVYFIENFVITGVKDGQVRIKLIVNLVTLFPDFNQSK